MNENDDVPPSGDDTSQSPDEPDPHQTRCRVSKIAYRNILGASLVMLVSFAWDMTTDMPLVPWAFVAGCVLLMAWCAFNCFWRPR